MGKRLIRIFPVEIPVRVASLVGKELNLVLTSNLTLHGILEKVNKDDVILKDPMNGNHTILLDEISEIVYDIEATY